MCIRFRYIYTKSLPLGFPHPTVKYVGESLGRPYLVGIVGRRGRGNRDRGPAAGPEVFAAVPVVGRVAVGGGPQVVVALRLGPRQRRPAAAAAAASRVPPGRPVLQVLLADAVLQRVLLPVPVSFTAAAADGRRGPVALAAVADRVPVPGVRLVRLALVPRRVRVPVGRLLVLVLMVMVRVAVRRRGPAGVRLDHGDLAGLVVLAAAPAAGLVCRLGAAAATVLVLVVMLQVMMIAVAVVLMVVMRRGGCGLDRGSRQRDLR